MNPHNFFMHRYRSEIIVCLFLIMAILVVYWPVKDYPFVTLDDSGYVTQNRRVKAGWSKEGFNWAFTTTHHRHWHPLTWLSHMTDVQLFGLDAGRHHLTSLFFHIANTILLFLILNRMTGARWRSAFVAALFAVHPLHVETVVWIADRKDILCAFFWLLAMGAYARYAERPGLLRYALVFLLFILALMAKSMAVTLPLVLLADGFLASRPLSTGAIGEVGRPAEPPTCELHLQAGIRVAPGWGKNIFFRGPGRRPGRNLCGGAQRAGRRPVKLADHQRIHRQRPGRLCQLYRQKCSGRKILQHPLPGLTPRRGGRHWEPAWCCCSCRYWPSAGPGKGLI